MEKRKTFIEEFYPEAEEVERSLESISNGLEEVTKMERDLNSLSTPTWIAEKLKDEMDELVTNLKSSSNLVIERVKDLTNANNSLDVNCIEYRIRKQHIANLSSKLVRLMTRCDKIQLDLQSTSSTKTSPKRKLSLLKSISSEEGARKAKLSKSVDDLREVFAEVVSNMSLNGSDALAVQYNVNTSQIRYSAADALKDYQENKMTTKWKYSLYASMVFLIILTYSFYFL